MRVADIKRPFGSAAALAPQVLLSATSAPISDCHPLRGIFLGLLVLSHLDPAAQVGTSEPDCVLGAMDGGCVHAAFCMYPACEETPEETPSSNGSLPDLSGNFGNRRAEAELLPKPWLICLPWQQGRRVVNPKRWQLNKRKRPQLKIRLCNHLVTFISRWLKGRVACQCALPAPSWSIMITVPVCVPCEHSACLLQPLTVSRWDVTQDFVCYYFVLRGGGSAFVFDETLDVSLASIDTLRPQLLDDAVVLGLCA